MLRAFLFNPLESILRTAFLCNYSSLLITCWSVSLDGERLWRGIFTFCLRFSAGFKSELLLDHYKTHSGHELFKLLSSIWYMHYLEKPFATENLFPQVVSLMRKVLNYETKQEFSQCHIKYFFLSSWKLLETHVHFALWFLCYLLYS